MTTHQRDEAVLEALVSGRSLVDLAAALDTSTLAITRHVATARFQGRMAPVQQDAAVASSTVASFLQCAMLLNGTAVKDGLAYRELRLLLDKYGRTTAPAPVADDRLDQKTRDALAIIERDRWKTRTAEA